MMMMKTNKYEFESEYAIDMHLKQIKLWLLTPSLPQNKVELKLGLFCSLETNIVQGGVRKVTS